MDLLIKHGTWIIVPIGLILSFVYLAVYPKVYPFLLARFLKEEDALNDSPQFEASEAPARVGTYETPKAAQSRV